MKLKVCGMQHPDNIRQVQAESPDWMGFIFYEKSPRVIREDLQLQNFNGIEKVGVFVNASLQEMERAVTRFGLNLVQLHGDETVFQIREIKEKLGLPVIKVFRILDQLPAGWEDFKSVADYFLFDTSTTTYGGSGKQFDWQVLGTVDHPFLLSGGIGETDIVEIQALGWSHLVGIDVNSKVELAPGVKDVHKIRAIKKQLAG